MRTITFFNEKGGTGKTTFTVMMASWLAYAQGCPVAVYDCDYPSYHLWNMRRWEVGYVQSEPLSPVARMAAVSRPYPVARALGRDTFTPAELEAVASGVRAARGDGYMLLDFPGRFLPNDPVTYLARQRLLDLIVFPIDTDVQSRSSALEVASRLRRLNPGQAMAAVWNREAPAERRGRRDWYTGPTAAMEAAGIPVFGTRMRDVLIARRAPSTFGFIRSTLCWPSQNVAKACPYVEALFTEIRERADGCKTRR